jgi:acetyltransferase-like isoleucine patch superfamily enzyme
MKNCFLKVIRIFRNRIGLLSAIRKNVTTGKNIHVGSGSVIEAPFCLEIGDNVYIGKYCTIECDGYIGNNVLIANNVGLIGRYDHDFSMVGVPVRQSPWIGNLEYEGQGKGLKIDIEDDVWIGYGSIILTGIRIGKGSIIAAGSVVNQDIPPYAIAAGNPARVKKYRFTQAQITEHEQRLNQNSPRLSEVRNN